MKCVIMYHCIVWILLLVSSVFNIIFFNLLSIHGNSDINICRNTYLFMNILLVLSGVGTGGERGSGAGALGPPPKKNILPHPTPLLLEKTSFFFKGPTSGWPPPLLPENFFSKGPTNGWAPTAPRAVLCTKRDVPKMHGHTLSLPIDTSLWY